MVSGPDPPPPEAETDGVLPEQWVGNLLTLRWWKEAWLTEGFASYVAYLGADHAEPAWNVVRSRFDVHRNQIKARCWWRPKLDVRQAGLQMLLLGFGRFSSGVWYHQEER